MSLPIGPGAHTPSCATWDQWLVRLNTGFVENFETSVFERDILLNLVCFYRAFTTGRGGLDAESDFYIAFTHGFLELARSAVGRCAKLDLALYLVDMHVLVPNVSPYPADLSMSCSRR